MITSSIIHSIHEMIRNVLLGLIVIGVALFFWLKSGIYVETFSAGDYQVTQLYIKLDKKLTLKAQKVTIPKSKAKPSFGSVDKTFDTIKYLLTFFDYIDLEQVVFRNNHLHIVYADNILYITTDDYEVAGNIRRKEETLQAEISLLYLKKKDIYITGNLNYDLKKHTLMTRGIFKRYGIDGNFTAVKNGEKIMFDLASKPFANLRPVIDQFKNIHPTVKSWIVDRIQAKTYSVHTLRGEGKINKEGKFILDIKRLKGKAAAENVKIHFHEKLDPIFAKRLEIEYRRGALYFNPRQAVYKKIDLSGSKIAILGLAKKKAVLKLDLKLKAPIDQEVQKILHAYKTDLPVRYSGKDALVNLRISLPLKKRKKGEKIKVKVETIVNLKKGIASYKNITLPIKKGWIIFDNSKKYNLKADVILGKGNAFIGKVRLPVVSGTLNYRNDHILLHKVHVKERWIEGVADGNIDVKKRSAKLNLLIEAMKIGDKESFFILRNKKLPLSIDFNQRLTIHLPTIKTKIIQERNEIRIVMKSLKLFKPYLKKNNIDFDDGTLMIVTKDKKRFILKGKLKCQRCFFYGKNGIDYAFIPFHAVITDQNFIIDAFDQRLYYNYGKGRINLKNINIDLKKLLKVRYGTVTKSIDTKKNIVIIGKNSDIRYEKYRLVTDSYDITFKPNGDIKALGSSRGNIVKFNKKGNIFTLKALRVTDRLLQPLINFKGLHGGRYSISMQGNPDKEMRGQIIVEGGVLSGFKAYNNTLAFINTIPALATLQSPGFSQKGFKIKKGVIEYRQTGDTIRFDSIYIKGGAATIVGKGTVNLKTKRLDMTLAIQTARELGKILGNVPLLGYILMGKDKSMTIGLKITGTLEKPKVETSAAKEILSLPLDLIKRTLESPAHIINR